MDPYTLDRGTLAGLLPGQPAYRADQIRGWLARGVDDPDAMTDLPRAVRGRLRAILDPPPRLLSHRVTDAGLTHKVLLEMGAPGDGEAVESVLMLYPRAPGRERGRATVCVSSQAGCAMGCPFCATGQAGFRRQLTVGEIVRQVTVMQRLLAGGEVQPASVPAQIRPAAGAPPPTVPAGVPDHVTNVVFMGMGEPLANLDATIGAVRWLHDPEGFGLSARGITVSTVGLVPGIRRLAALSLPITLAVSLHAPNDGLRDDLVPVNRQFPLAQLLAAAADYRDTTGRRLTFEYVLIGGINDRLEHARELAALVGSLDAHVNLIPMNPTPAVPWRQPAVAEQRAFADVLRRSGVAATIRHNRGGEIDAACGQLYANHRMASGRTLPAAVGAAGRLGVAAAGGADEALDADPAAGSPTVAAPAGDVASREQEGRERQGPTAVALPASRRAG